MNVRIQKWGNSLALRIPKPFAKEAGVEQGSVVRLAVAGGKLVAAPVRRRKLDLAELLAGVRKSNLHGEVSWGGPVGREGW